MWTNTNSNNYKPFSVTYSFLDLLAPREQSPFILSHLLLPHSPPSIYFSCHITENSNHDSLLPYRIVDGSMEI